MDVLSDAGRLSPSDRARAIVDFHIDPGHPRKTRTCGSRLVAMAAPWVPPLGRAFAPTPRRTQVWALPLLLALVALGIAAAWLQVGDNRDLEERRHTLISDTLSLEQQLRSQVLVEQARVEAIARAIADGSITLRNFDSAAEVVGGLRQRWLSITWIDRDGRIVAQLPGGPGAERIAAESERRGLSAHLEAVVPASPIGSGGRIVVRYSLTALLAEHTPWWLARKYVVRLVDTFDEVLASTAQRTERAAGEVHRISFDPPIHGVLLEVQERDRFKPWVRTYPLALFGLVLASLVWATWLLRRQMRSVEHTADAWNTEAAWRRAMEDALTVGLRARDLQGRLIYANPRFVEMTGYPLDELLGRAPPMPYWPPDALDETFERFRRNLSGGAPRDGYETRWRRKDGRTIDVMVFEAPLVNAQGHHVGWMGSVVDITERKRADDLERRRAERMAHQARLMTMGEIASSLAHELNQPLTAIASYNAGVRNALAALPNIEARLLNALDRQAEQAAHAGRIVQRIREFLSHRSPRQERCRLREVVDRAIELVRSDLKHQGIALHVTHDARAPEVHADPVLIEQVVINLVRNAADAMAGRDGVKRIEVRTVASRDGETSRVEVDDRGPGLGGRGLEELTAPFYSTKDDGMGLGLAICRSIVEAHVGHLDATDLPGGGARFAFALPVTERSHVG